MKSCAYVASFLVFLAGCNQPSGPLAHEPDSVFEFRNASESMIWVNSVSGFANDPRCGVLVPGTSAMLTLYPQETPETFTVEWWKGDRTNRESETIESPLSLADIPPEQRKGMLVFVFEADETWTVHFEPVPY